MPEEHEKIQGSQIPLVLKVTRADLDKYSKPALPVLTQFDCADDSGPAISHTRRASSGLRTIFVIVVSLSWNVGSIILLWATGLFDVKPSNDFVAILIPALLIAILALNVPLINWALYVGDDPPYDTRNNAHD